MRGYQQHSLNQWNKAPPRWSRDQQKSTATNRYRLATEEADEDGGEQEQFVMDFDNPWRERNSPGARKKLTGRYTSHYNRTT